jgi:hypothetical protein
MMNHDPARLVIALHKKAPVTVCGPGAFTARSRVIARVQPARFQRPAADRGDSGAIVQLWIRYRSYDGSVFRLRGPSRLFIVPTMYIPTAIITTPRKATQHKSAKQASGIASANKTSRCMSCPSPPRPNNDRTRSDVPQPEAIFLSRRKFNATPNVDAAACGLTLRHRREALRQGRAPASYPGERTVRLCYRVARNLPAGGIR